MVERARTKSTPVTKSLKKLAKESIRRCVSPEDDKTAIELFLTGIWGWEVGLRRKLENGKSG